MQKTKISPTWLLSKRAESIVYLTIKGRITEEIEKNITAMIAYIICFLKGLRYLPNLFTIFES